MIIIVLICTQTALIMCHHYCFIYFNRIPAKLYEVETTIILIYRQKSKQRGQKSYLTQWQSWDLNPGRPALESLFLYTYSVFPELIL